MMGKMAWLRVAAQNRQTILKLVREAFFGRRTVPTNLEVNDELEGGAPAEVAGEVNA
jgi:hypothetical protein